MSADRIAPPIQARSRGRQSSCSTKTGRSTFAALTSFALVFLLACRRSSALVGNPGAVVNAVVEREPVAEVLEHGPRRGFRDQAELWDDQPLEEDLHQKDLLLERVGADDELRHLVEVGVTLPLAAGDSTSCSHASVWRDSSCTIVV